MSLGTALGPKASTEVPVVFDCQGSRLVGVVHLPVQPRARGLLSVVAGGPQYRAGLARMQVRLARRLAAEGVAVMRFDYRGLGDSEGQFRGFRHVEADIAAALQTFLQQVPSMREVALWGGCDASSASLINGWKFPQVTSLLLGNPFVHSEETGDKVAVAHYRQRLRDRDFWLKLLRGGYNPLPAVRTLLRSVRTRLRHALPGAADDLATAVSLDDPHMPYQQRMCLGLSRFKGDILMLISGRSLTSMEFDQLVSQSPAWQQALCSPARILRVDLPDADQAYSAITTQNEVIELVTRWMCDPTQVAGHHGASAVLGAAKARLQTATGHES